jgi:hypothetical protein
VAGFGVSKCYSREQIIPRTTDNSHRREYINKLAISDVLGNILQNVLVKNIACGIRFG